MYCTSCGNEIPEDSDFCIHCGSNLKGSPKNTKITESGNKSAENHLDKETAEENPSSKQTNDYFDIEIPGASGSKIVRFTDSAMSCEGTTINYDDIEGISCKQIYHSLNLVPTHQEFSFTFHGSDKNIHLSFGTTLHIGAKSRKEIFFKLYALSKQILSPIIVSKLAKRILDEGETINIGGVNFNKHGYYKKKFFGGEEWVHWTENIGEPSIESGSIVLYKSATDKYKHFASIPLQTMNALVVPDLVVAMYVFSNPE